MTMQNRQKANAKNNKKNWVTQRRSVYGDQRSQLVAVISIKNRIRLLLLTVLFFGMSIVDKLALVDLWRLIINKKKMKEQIEKLSRHVLESSAKWRLIGYFWEIVLITFPRSSVVSCSRHGVWYRGYVASRCIVWEHWPDTRGNSWHGLLICYIGGLDCRVIKTVK